MLRQTLRQNLGISYGITCAGIASPAFERHNAERLVLVILARMVQTSSDFLTQAAALLRSRGAA
eukprot:361737-Amphidinium_carterae.1